MCFDALCFAKNEEIHLVFKYAAKRQPQGLCGKIVLRVEISSFSRVSHEILTDALKFVLTFMPNAIESDSLKPFSELYSKLKFES